MKNEGLNTSMRSLNKVSYPKLEGMMRTSDTEDYSDVKTEDEEAQPMMVKPAGLKPAIKPAGGLWKKVEKQLLSSHNTPEPEKSPLAKNALLWLGTKILYICAGGQKC